MTISASLPAVRFGMYQPNSNSIICLSTGNHVTSEESAEQNQPQYTNNNLENGSTDSKPALQRIVETKTSIVTQEHNPFQQFRKAEATRIAHAFRRQQTHHVLLGENLPPDVLQGLLSDVQRQSGFPMYHLNQKAFTSALDEKEKPDDLVTIEESGDQGEDNLVTINEVTDQGEDNLGTINVIIEQGEPAKIGLLASSRGTSSLPPIIKKNCILIAAPSHTADLDPILNPIKAARTFWGTNMGTPQKANNPNPTPQKSDLNPPQLLANIANAIRNETGQPRTQKLALVIDTFPNLDQLLQPQFAETLQKLDPNLRLIVRHQGALEENPARWQLGAFEIASAKAVTHQEQAETFIRDKNVEAVAQNYEIQWNQAVLSAFITKLQEAALKSQQQPFQDQHPIYISNGLSPLTPAKPSALTLSKLLPELDAFGEFINRTKGAGRAVQVQDVYAYFQKEHPAGQLQEAVETGGFDAAPYEIILPGEIGTQFNDIVGHEEAKNVLRRAMEITKYPELYEHLNEGDEDANNHYVLLMGEPGNGKTLLAKALAGESNASFISTSGSNFVNVFVGMGANNVRQLQDAVRNAQEDLVIVYIDELDALGNRESLDANGEDAKTINQVLGFMEGLKSNGKKVLLVGATNHPQNVDKAILSRFHNKITILPPDANGRKQQFENQFKQKKLTLDATVKMDQLVALTDGFSGRDIRVVAREAKGMALDRIPPDRKELLNNTPALLKQFTLNVSQADLENAVTKVKAGIQAAKQLNQFKAPRIGFDQTANAS